MKHVKMKLGNIACLLAAIVFQGVTSTAATKNPLADSVKILQIGDTFPDIPLRMYNGDQTLSVNIADYRNKLVILDFWHTGCASCIKAIPHMKLLQAEFPDKLKILYVNMWETKEQVENRLSKYGRRDLVDYFEESRSLVIGGDDFKRYFREIRVVPHHVWIGKDGRMLGAGAFENSNGQKVREYLGGIAVEFMGDANTSIRYDGSKSLEEFTSSGYQTDTVPRFMFTPYNNRYSAGYGGAVAEGKVDSETNTVRDTYLNHDILSLFKRAVQDSTLNAGMKVAYSTNRNNSNYWLDFISLPEAVDTLRLTTSYHNPLQTTDYDIRNSSLCYEQQTPVDWTDKQRREYMLANLKAFLVKEMGLRCAVAKQRRKVYEIFRTSAVDKVSAVSLDSEARGAKDTVINGIPMKAYTNWAFSEKSTTVFTSSLFQSFHYRYRKSDPDMLILDRTGFKSRLKHRLPELNMFRVDIIMPLPVNITSLFDLRSALSPYDLDIRETTIEVDFISFEFVDK